MPILHFETILYVEDQKRSREFYRAILGTEPTLDVPGMTEFEIAGAKLGLMPATGIKKLLGDAIINPTRAKGIPRCELYLLVDDPSSYVERALSAGATLVSPLQPRDWGDEAAYVADPDFHIIAFARGRS